MLVTGATGFIGRALLPALQAASREVVAASRQPPASGGERGLVWRNVDLLRPATLPAALSGVQVAYYLVHSMGDGQRDFRDQERRSAEAFVLAAHQAGVERIVYLGGVAPAGQPSEHLASRLAVGAILRGGPVSALELRASMVIGAGSASWQIVRDLAVRLPAMVLPRWLKSRTCPVSLDDVVKGLVAAATLPLERNEWFDVPGPEVMSGRQILERIAALRGRRILAVEVPFLSPRLSALWLRLVTRTDFTLARELAVGLSEDLLPRDRRFWERIGHRELLSFDEAAHRALQSESGAGHRRPTRGALPGRGASGG